MISGTILSDVIALAREAGAAALEFYHPDTPVWTKDDHSPLTLADQASHACIVHGLPDIDQETPVISEEGEHPSYDERRDWSRFWLVDPLDGTKEFLKGNGEFTINMALIEEGRPALAVILAPASGRCYYAADGQGVWRQDGTDDPVPIRVSGATAAGPLAVVESRSHPSAALERYLEPLHVVRRVPAGSSLKFCLVADGTADVYPRLGPTMEWDVAAGHGIAAMAGATVQGLTYNGPQLRNGPFVVGPSGLPSPADLVEVG